MKRVIIVSLDREKRPHVVRAPFIRGALAVAEEIHAVDHGWNDRVWRVVHIHSGGALPIWALEYRKAKALLLEALPLAPWDSLRTLEDVAALPAETRAKLREVVARWERS